MRTVVWRAVVAGVLLGLLSTLAWALTGGPFWPRWVWLGLALAAALAYVGFRALRIAHGPRRWLALEGGLLAVLFPFDVVVWLMTGRGHFWPAYSAAGLSVLIGLHQWWLSRRPSAEEGALRRRIDTLVRSRATAVDLQAIELRRVERDLHDGAQARMTSTALAIGIAERQVTSDPDAALRTLRQARSTARAAVEDLRVVMRQIYPPVLADRGVLGAVEALAVDLAVPVVITGADPPLPPPLAAAVYFGTAECLANVVKHAGASQVEVRFDRHHDGASVEVVDDGCGGARLDAGSGLEGVRRRLSVFDGELHLDSPVGGPTRVRMRVPR